MIAELTRVTTLARPSEPIGDDMGDGIRAIPRSIVGRMLVDYTIDGELFATAYVDLADCAARIEFAKGEKLSSIDVVRRMFVMSLAVSRANQMSYALSLKRPATDPDRNSLARRPR